MIHARLFGVPWMSLCEMFSDERTGEGKDWLFPQYMADPAFTVAVSGTEPSGNMGVELPYKKPGLLRIRNLNILLDNRFNLHG
jgi:hypothetical protein